MYCVYGSILSVMSNTGSCIYVHVYIIMVQFRVESLVTMITFIILGVYGGAYVVTDLI